MLPFFSSLFLCPLPLFLLSLSLFSVCPSIHPSLSCCLCVSVYLCMSIPFPRLLLTPQTKQRHPCKTNKHSLITLLLLLLVWSSPSKRCPCPTFVQFISQSFPFVHRFPHPGSKTCCLRPSAFAFAWCHKNTIIYPISDNNMLVAYSFITISHRCLPPIIRPAAPAEVLSLPRLHRSTLLLQSPPTIMLRSSDTATSLRSSFETPFEMIYQKCKYTQK